MTIIYFEGYTNVGESKMKVVNSLLNSLSLDFV